MAIIRPVKNGLDTADFTARIKVLEQALRKDGRLPEWGVRFLTKKITRLECPVMLVGLTGNEKQVFDEMLIEHGLCLRVFEDKASLFATKSEK